MYLNTYPSDVAGAPIGKDIPISIENKAIVLRGKKLKAIIAAVVAITLISLAIIATYKVKPFQKASSLECVGLYTGAIVSFVISALYLHAAAQQKKKEEPIDTKTQVEYLTDIINSI